MSDFDSVEQDGNCLKIDPIKFVQEELGKIVIDPSGEFAAMKELIDDWTDWILSDGDIDESRQHVEAEGLIILDPSKDPDPFGNHGVSIADRFAAMGWPASVPLYLERVEPYRAEDLL